MRNNKRVKIKVSIEGIDNIIDSLRDAMIADANDPRLPFSISVKRNAAIKRLVISFKTDDLGDSRAFLASTLRLLRAAGTTLLLIGK